MTGPSIRIATGILGTIAAVVGEAFAVGTGRPPNEALLHLAIGLTYLHGGLAIWGHEPANRTGRLMVLVGLTWFIGTLNGSEIGIVREVVLAIEDTWTVLLVALVLSCPGGRFDNRLAFDFALELPDGERQFEARVAPSGPDEVTAIIRDFTAQRAAETELRRSRARIVEATDAERQRLERDLHDGAQQRLVSLSLALRLLRARLGGTDGTNAEAIAASDQAAAELKAAIIELRELARGIHPTILTEAGLGAALTSLVDRSVIPASVSSLPDRRLSQAIEATAYFVVSEALTNTAKYASATRASVGAACVGSTLRVEVADDGVGGADDSRGTGIRGLQDRVAALGGRLTIESPAGQGTLVVAEIPIG